MKILIISPHFYPEDFKCNDMAFDLAKRGHDVTVLSDIPNYPIGHFYDGYGILKRRKEIIKGVRIIRTFVIPRGNGCALRLALNYASFAFFASFIAMYLAIFKKYDAIIVHETSPITVGIPAVIVKKIQKIPLYFWVLDLWPESLTAAGGIRNKYIITLFAKITQWIYSNSTKILISSKGFEQSILEKGNFKDRIIYFPNWVDDVLAKKSSVKIPKLPTGFKVMFAGNIGEAQDFENIMSAAYLLKEDKNIHFIILGDGRKRMWVNKYINENCLYDTVHCLGRFPLESMSTFFEQADVLLVTLKNELIFNLTVPAKVQAYMSAGKPIVAMLNGEGASLINEAHCGIVVKAGSYYRLAEAIKTLSNKNSSELSNMGKAARQYCEEYFDFHKCMDNLVEIITKNNHYLN